MTSQQLRIEQFKQNITSLIMNNELTQALNELNNVRAFKRCYGFDIMSPYNVSLFLQAIDFETVNNSLH